MKTGLSFAEAVYAKVAARRAGSATLRMVEIRRTKTSGERGEEEIERKREVCKVVRLGGTKSN